MSVFISYAGPDHAAAQATHGAIVEGGGAVWIAPVSLLGSAPFSNEIAQAICDADCLIVICSVNSARSDWVMREVNHAIANGKPIVPVVVGEFPRSSALHLIVGPIDWIEARQGFTTDIKQAIVRRSVRVPQGRVVTTLNLKGGVGKTTLTANVASEAHFGRKKSVLFIDLDPQYNLTQYFLAESQIEPLREQNRTVLSLLDAKNASAMDIARIRDRCFSLLTKSGERADELPLDLLAGHDDLFAYTIEERSVSAMHGAMANFAAFVGACRPYYNIIMIDVNPSASFLTRCALSVADHVMAPVRPERYALNGLRLLQRWLSRVRGREFDSSEVSVVINKMAERYPAASADLDEQTREKIRSSDAWRNSLAPVIIPYSVTLAPSAYDAAADRPVSMLARFSRAGPDLKAALTKTAHFVFSRAGVRGA